MKSTISITKISGRQQTWFTLMTNQNICTIPAEHLLSSHLYGLAKIKFLKKKKFYCNENYSKRRQYRIHFMLITDVTSSFSPLLGGWMTRGRWNNIFWLFHCGHPIDNKHSHTFTARCSIASWPLCFNYVPLEEQMYRHSQHRQRAEEWDGGV